MRTIAIVSNKGGVGKTTIALHLACEFARGGKMVGVVDLDPQSSAAVWYDHRIDSGRGGPEVIDAKPKRLERALADLERRGVEIAIIDTAPHSNSISMPAITLADRIIVPCGPSMLDIEGNRFTFSAIASARKMADTSVVLNGVQPRVADTAACRAFFEGDDIHVVSQPIGFRVIYKRAIAAGLVAHELEPQSKAAEEIAAVAAAV